MNVKLTDTIIAHKCRKIKYHAGCYGRMNKTMKKRNILIFVALLVVANIIGWSYFNNQDNTNQNEIVRKPPLPTREGLVNYVNAKGEEWAIPEGEMKFNTASAEVFPKIVTGIISPLDVKVGDVQQMLIAVNGDAPVRRVWAEVETDNDVKKVELNVTGTTTVSAADRMKQPYLVDAKGYLVVNDGKNNSAFSDLVNVAEASAPITQFTYEGSWKVEDTHTKTYHTKFVVEDSSGRLASTTLAWSDPVCLYTVAGGNGTLQAGCTLSSLDGFDGGDVALGGQALTISTGGEFVMNSGKSVSIGSGSMNVAASGAKIRLGVNLFLPDGDADGYAPDLTVTTSTAATVGGKVRLKDALGTKIANTQYPATGGFIAGVDCNDSSNIVYPNNDNWYSNSNIPAPLGKNDIRGDYNCNGSQEHGLMGYTTSWVAVPYSSARFDSYVCSYPNGKIFSMSDYGHDTCGTPLYYSSGVIDTGSFFQSPNASTCGNSILVTTGGGTAIGCH